MGRINILEKNICTIPECRCGWNIKIGSDDYALLDDLAAWLFNQGMTVKDYTENSELEAKGEKV